MEENLENNLEENNPDTDYIEVIQDLKKNTVSKEVYEQALEKNRKLVQALGRETPVKDEAPVVKTAAECRTALFKSGELTNLEYCKRALELREAVLREEGKDIFVANNAVMTPTPESYDAAARVADVMQQCIDAAQGDSIAFTNELMRRTNDVRIPGLNRFGN